MFFIKSVPRCKPGLGLGRIAANFIFSVQQFGKKGSNIIFDYAKVVSVLAAPCHSQSNMALSWSLMIVKRRHI